MGALRRERLALVALIALAASPLLLTGGALNLDHDWLTHLLHHRFTRDALLSGSLPTWSPWVAGGYPVAGHPEAPFPSPLTLSTLLLGEAVGLKVNAALFLGIGLAGTHRLARRAGASAAGALAAAAALAASSWFTWCVSDGNYVELHALVFPAVAAALWRASVPGAALAAALISLVVFDGNVALLSVGLMLLVTLLLAPDEPRRRLRLRRLAAVTVAMAGAALLSAGKLVPMLWLLARDARGLDDYADAADVFYTAWGLLESLVQLEPAGRRPYALSRIHMGPLLLLAAAALPLDRLRAWRWAALAAAAALLAMGPSAPVDLFRALWHLPLFHSMRHPAKAYDPFLVIALSLLVGVAVDALIRRWPGRGRWLLGLSLSLSLVAWIRLPAVTVSAFAAPAMPEARVEAFYQVQGTGLGRYDGRPLAAEAYPNLLRDVGTIDWKQNLAWEERARPRYLIDRRGGATAAPGYRGEAWLASGAGRVLSVTPRHDGVDVQVSLESASGVLVINQNHDPGFAGVRGLGQREGLLAVSLEGAGEHRVSPRLEVPWARAGLALQGLMWLALVVWGSLTALSARPGRRPR